MWSPDEYKEKFKELQGSLHGYGLETEACFKAFRGGILLSEGLLAEAKADQVRARKRGKVAWPSDSLLRVDQRFDNRVEVVEALNRKFPLVPWYSGINIPFPPAHAEKVRSVLTRYGFEQCYVSLGPREYGRQDCDLYVRGTSSLLEMGFSEYRDRLVQNVRELTCILYSASDMAPRATIDEVEPILVAALQSLDGMNLSRGEAIQRYLKKCLEELSKE